MTPEQRALVVAAQLEGRIRAGRVMATVHVRLPWGWASCWNDEELEAALRGQVMPVPYSARWPGRERGGPFLEAVRKALGAV